MVYVLSNILLLLFLRSETISAATVDGFIAFNGKKKKKTSWLLDYLTSSRPVRWQWSDYSKKSFSDNTSPPSRLTFRLLSSYYRHRRNVYNDDDEKIIIYYHVLIGVAKVRFEMRSIKPNTRLRWRSCVLLKRIYSRVAVGERFERKIPTARRAHLTPPRGEGISVYSTRHISRSFATDRNFDKPIHVVRQANNSSLFPAPPRRYRVIRVISAKSNIIILHNRSIQRKSTSNIRRVRRTGVLSGFT